MHCAGFGVSELQGWYFFTLLPIDGFRPVKSFAVIFEGALCDVRSRVADRLWQLCVNGFQFRLAQDLPAFVPDNVINDRRITRLRATRVIGRGSRQDKERQYKQCYVHKMFPRAEWSFCEPSASRFGATYFVCKNSPNLY